MSYLQCWYYYKCFDSFEVVDFGYKVYYFVVEYKLDYLDFVDYYNNFVDFDMDDY